MTKGAVVVELFGKQRRIDENTVTDDEQLIVDIHTGMLSDPDWLIPIGTAQQTYRAVYYGMTATALLEDVHFDSLANWLNRHRPGVVLTKPQRGALGDYNVDGVDVSHKSMSGPTDTGVNWNALSAAEKVADKKTAKWTSDTPIMVVSAHHELKTVEWHSGGTKPLKGRVAYPAPDNPPRKQKPMLVRWDLDDRAEVLAVWDALPSFEELWLVVGTHFAAGTPAYLLDLMYLPETIKVGDVATMTSASRPGQYLFPKALLSDVPVSSNNRGLLVKKPTIKELMAASRQLNLWTPMPVWPALFAGERPPDLYLSLRADFDRRFSPAGA